MVKLTLSLFMLMLPDMMMIPGPQSTLDQVLIVGFIGSVGVLPTEGAAGIADLTVSGGITAIVNRVSPHLLDARAAVFLMPTRRGPLPQVPEGVPPRPMFQDP